MKTEKGIQLEVNQKLLHALSIAEFVYYLSLVLINLLCVCTLSL